MFYCHDCETFYNEDELTRRVESDPFGTGDVWHREVTLICPCGGEDVEDKEPCLTCGEKLPLEGYDDCDECVVHV